MVVLPIESGVTTEPEIVAIFGSLDVKVQAPVELDVGVTRVKLEILERLKVTSPNAPKVGGINSTVRVVYAEAEFHAAVVA